MWFAVGFWWAFHGCATAIIATFSSHIVRYGSILWCNSSKNKVSSSSFATWFLSCELCMHSVEIVVYQLLTHDMENKVIRKMGIPLNTRVDNPSVAFMFVYSTRNVTITFLSCFNLVFVHKQHPEIMMMLWKLSNPSVHLWWLLDKSFWITFNSIWFQH